MRGYAPITLPTVDEAALRLERCGCGKGSPALRARQLVDPRLMSGNALNRENLSPSGLIIYIQVFQSEKKVLYTLSMQVFINRLNIAGWKYRECWESARLRMKAVRTSAGPILSCKAAIVPPRATTALQIPTRRWFADMTAGSDSERGDTSFNHGSTLSTGDQSLLPGQWIQQWYAICERGRRCWSTSLAPLTNSSWCTAATVAWSSMSVIPGYEHREEEEGRRTPHNSRTKKTEGVYAGADAQPQPKKCKQSAAVNCSPLNR
ncbi:hypothetical protein FB451DRAFT_1193007 [Mycena latifolia]|nr:hypothetical protein FB451DRAFT_1193007 [Mycena latifolia]